MGSLLLSIGSVFIPIALQLIFLRTVSYTVQSDVYGFFVLFQTVVLGVSSAFMQIPLTAQSRFHNSKIYKHQILEKFHGATLIASLLSIISFACAIFYIPAMQDSRIYIIGAIYTFISNIIAVDQQYLLLELRRKDFLLTKVAESVSRFVLPIFFYRIYEDLLSMIFGLAVGALITYCICARLTKTLFINQKLDFDLLKKSLCYAWPTASVAIASWCIIYLNRFFINNALGPSILADYALLFQLSSFASVVGQVYGNHYNPIVLKTYSTNKMDSITLLNSSIRLFATILLIVYACAFFVPDNLYQLLISPKIWESTGNRTVFFVLLLANIFSLLQNASAMFYVISGKLHYTFYFYVVGLLLSLLGNQLISHYGIFAASVTVLISNITLFLLHFIYGRRIVSYCA